MISFVALYKVFLKHQLTKGRLFLIAALTLTSLSLAWLIRSQATTEVEILDGSLQLVILFGTNLMVPIISLILASGTLGQLVEDETLVYLWLRPNNRFLLAISSWLATATVVIPTCAIPLLISAGIASRDWGLAVNTFVGVTVGCLTYSAVFILLGLLTKKSTITGLLYIFIWEALIVTAIGLTTPIGKLSIVYYIRSIIGEYASNTASDFEQFVSTSSISTSITVLIVISAVGVALTSLRLSKMDVA